MDSNVSLTELEKVISFCLHPEKEDVDVLSFPWVRDRLSWFSRASGYLWGKKSESWLGKHLFPILLEVSIPQLEMFSEGNWKVADETKLKSIFDYFSMRIEACRQKIPKPLEAFLLGPTPSFYQERSRIQALCSTKTSLQWYRDETFAQYKNRMNTLNQQQKKETTLYHPVRKGEVEEAGFIPRALLPKSKERIEAFIGRFQKLKEECALCNYQLDKDIAKAFPLRNEFDFLVGGIQEVKDDLLGILLAIEDEISRLTESFVTMGEDEVYALFEEEEAFLKEVQAQFKGIQHRSEENRIDVEEKRAFLHKKLQQITRLVDKMQILPAASTFRNHQSRLVRMARDRIKKYKDALQKGPGPDMPLCSLEKDICLFIEMGKDFYDEGVEIESMKEQLIRFSKQLEKVIEKKGSTDILKGILSDVNILKKNLEVSADRKKHFENIVKALSDVDVLEEK
jgi:hypothetical protein